MLELPSMPTLQRDWIRGPYLEQIPPYQPISDNGVVAGGGGPTGPGGVREKRGAGAACSTPCAVITVERAVRWALVAASVQVSTGVTHPSVPAKTSVHSSRVRLANRSAKASCIFGYDAISS